MSESYGAGREYERRCRKYRLVFFHFKWRCPEPAAVENGVARRDCRKKYYVLHHLSFVNVSLKRRTFITNAAAMNIVVMDRGAMMNAAIVSSPMEKRYIKTFIFVPMFSPFYDQR
jgi:hypothetical protein